jgi:NADPH-dependent 2,4-dienoyl-CoA reductase/sulfur reductase-like enzyme/nitrite reductase/ring-hydroxylating ferredoxin subunit
LKQPGAAAEQHVARGVQISMDKSPGREMQKVAILSALPRDRGLAVERDGQSVLLVRDGDAVRAYGGKCPHAGAPLDQGAICEHRIICPWHKAAFSLSDGSLLEPPALQALPRFEVALSGDDILLGGEIAPPPARAGEAGGTILIAGAGAAGVAASVSLREFGYGGRILLVGREPGLPYDRTALSKFVLAGQMPPADVPPLQRASFYRDHRIDRVESAITRLDVSTCHAVLADGQTIAFETALLATGAAPVPIKLPGAGLRGVHTLRSRADAAAILASLQGAARAVILGSSFIGLEAACGLRAQERDVTVISPEAIPFAHQFGSEIGLSVRALHERHGVRFLTGKAARIEGDGAVRQVVLENGTILPADIVLVAVGVRPVTDFVTGLRREADGGLRVDAGMRVTGNIYAAGDIASFPLALGTGRARIEHWRVAQQQGRIAARNMAGGEARYDGVPFFWTYHYGERYEYLGHADEWDEIVTDGDIGATNFLALLCLRGMVVAAVACGRERETATLIERMRRPMTAQEGRKAFFFEKKKQKTFATALNG